MNKLVTQFVDGWKNSEGHCDNMLDPAVTEIGVAVARAEDGVTYFAVQMFGRPEAASIDFSIANRTSQLVKYRTIREGSKKTFTLPPNVVRKHRRCRPTELQVVGSEKDSVIQAMDDHEFQVELDGGKPRLTRTGKAGASTGNR